MTGNDFIAFTNDQKLTMEEVAEIFGVTLRTVYYWRDRDEVPGPVSLAIKYWPKKEQG